MWKLQLVLGNGFGTCLLAYDNWDDMLEAAHYWLGRPVPMLLGGIPFMEWVVTDWHIIRG